MASFAAHSFLGDLSFSGSAGLSARPSSRSPRAALFQALVDRRMSVVRRGLHPREIWVDETRLILGGKRERRAMLPFVAN